MGHEVFVLPTAITDNIKPTLPKFGNILCYGFACYGNPDGGEVLDDISNCCRMRLVRFTP